MAQNTLPELMAYFSTEGKKVSTSEFQAFWKSLSDEEKEFYKNADLGEK